MCAALRMSTSFRFKFDFVETIFEIYSTHVNLKRKPHGLTKTVASRVVAYRAQTAVASLMVAHVQTNCIALIGRIARSRIACAVTLRAVASHAVALCTVASRAVASRTQSHCARSHRVQSHCACSCIAHAVALCAVTSRGRKVVAVASRVAPREGKRKERGGERNTDKPSGKHKESIVAVSRAAVSRAAVGRAAVNQKS